MAAQPIRLGSLDFDDIKASIKNYLRDQTEWTDYNFEGSGISQLINVLAYNAHYNSLTANFLANEMFLDTAVKRTSVISRAKELGYVPRSRRASKSTINISMKNIANEGSIDSIVLPSGSRFSTTVNDESFTFTTIEAVALTKVIELGLPVFKGEVNIYEGVLTQVSTSYDATTNLINIVNADIDTTTLKVEVYESNAWTPFFQPQYYLDLTSATNAFMLQEGFNGYEIYFGDGTLGRRPADTSNVRMTYVVTSGNTANDATNFRLVSTVAGMVSNTIVTITATQSAGGQEAEDIESIRINAKNIFGSQNRAVTSSDYASITMQNFTNIKDVISWDGSDNNPPRFGRIMLCVQPIVGDVISTVEKEAIAEFLQKKGVGNVKVEFYDPTYLGIEVVCTVKYDINKIKVSTYELGYIVQSVINTYATSIQKFGGTFRYSTLISQIDDSDYSILSNETLVRINKTLIPSLYVANNFTFSFVNSVNAGTVQSSYFYDGTTDNKLMIKDLNGKLHVYYSLNGEDVLYLSNAGTVDYVTGMITISNLNIAGLEDGSFKISAQTENFDISASKNNILKLDQSKLSVKVIKDAA